MLNLFKKVFDRQGARDSKINKAYQAAGVDYKKNTREEKAENKLDQDLTTIKENFVGAAMAAIATENACPNELSVASREVITEYNAVLGKGVSSSDVSAFKEFVTAKAKAVGIKF